MNKTKTLPPNHQRGTFKKRKTKEQKAFEKANKLELTKLMELRCPSWLTSKIYRDYLDNFDIWHHNQILYKIFQFYSSRHGHPCNCYIWDIDSSV